MATVSHDHRVNPPTTDVDVPVEVSPARHRRGLERLSTGPVLFWGYLVLSVAVILFAAATAYGYLKIREQTDLAQYNSQSALWLVVSFEREYLKFDAMIAKYAQGELRDADELLTQFDVLWSRIDLMTIEGEHSRPLQRVESYTQTVPVAAGLVREYEDAIFSALPAGEPFPADFVERYRDMADLIHHFMVDVHINRSWAVDAREAQIRNTRLAIYTTLAGTLVSTLLLFGIVVSHLKTRHSNLLRTQAALEQSENDREALSCEVTRRQAVEKERTQLLADLEARNEELERYAYTISHDLKSPLYTIQGFTGFLEQNLKHGDTDKVMQDLTTIRDAVRTMSQQLDDILNLSRINLTEGSMQDISLGDIVRRATMLVAREISDRGVIVDVQVDLPDVFGDPQRLTEVFQNLLSNAAKFMGDQPEPRVEIGARIVDGWVHCYVRDNGIGIDEAYQDRIFQLFERLETSTHGTGIGLAIVKRIVEQHGGTIRVESGGVGSGTRFSFTLPLPASAMAEAAT